MFIFDEMDKLNPHLIDNLTSFSGLQAPHTYLN